MPELVYYIAATLDGFIAHEDGSFNGFKWDDDVVADFMSDQEQFGTVLMGRKTYEVGLKDGVTNPYPKMRQIVFSKSLSQSPDQAVELVATDPAPYVAQLKSTTNHSIWLCGGAEIATQILEAGLIDKIVVKLNPVIFGSGIPLFNAIDSTRSLSLEKTKKYECGIVFLTYRVM